MNENLKHEVLKQKENLMHDRDVCLSKNQWKPISLKQPEKKIIEKRIKHESKSTQSKRKKKKSEVKFRSNEWKK